MGLQRLTRVLSIACCIHPTTVFWYSRLNIWCIVCLLTPSFRARVKPLPLPPSKDGRPHGGAPEHTRFVLFNVPVFNIGNAQSIWSGLFSLIPYANPEVTFWRQLPQSIVLLHWRCRRLFRAGCHPEMCHSVQCETPSAAHPMFHSRLS